MSLSNLKKARIVAALSGGGTLHNVLKHMHISYKEYRRARGEDAVFARNVDDAQKKRFIDMRNKR